MANVTAAMVKALRQRTQAGMMDCKKALVEAEGDEEKAVEIIQKKGLAKVAKKSGAIAAEGVIHAYIHGGKIGVIVEINCQTDFVARNEDFKAFSEDMGMHIAASGPEFVRREDIPADKLEAQRSLFRGMIEEEDKARGKSRPAEFVEKSVDGKLEKWVVERVLFEQESIVVEGKTIKQVQDELSAKIGEKISVRRFVRYELGEGIEKKKVDLAADVAATLAN